MAAEFSFRGKILGSVSVLAIIGFSGAIGYSTWSATQYSLKQGADTALLQAQALTQTISNPIYEARDLAENMAVMINSLHSNGQNQRELITRILGSELKKRERMIGLWSGWESNAFDGKDSEFANQAPYHDATGRFIPYWSRNGKGEVKVEPLLDYDKPGAGDYYLVPKQNGHLTFIEPYLYPIDGKNVLMTSIVEPIKQNDKFVGVVGVDVSLDSIGEVLSTIHPYQNGYVSLISNAGNWVVNPDKAKITKAIGDELPAEAASAIKNGTAYEYTDNQDEMHFLVPIKIDPHMAPWSLRVSIPKASLLAEANGVRNTTLMISFLAVAIMLGLIAVILRSLSRPLVNLSSTMQTLSQGEGDLTQRLEVTSSDEIGQTSGAFNQFMDKLRTMFGEVKQHTNTLHRSVDQLAQIGQQVESNARRQADAARASAATIEEMTVSISHIANNAKDAEETAKTSSGIASNVEQLVTSTANEIRTAAHAVDTLSGTLNTLNERSEQISSIVSVISEIADQTNLLALNAAIEAARAGEQGRGFAVVADEVRKLAERTGMATQEIASMITAIQTEMRTATTGMDSANAQINNGVSLSKQASEAIAAIYENSQQVMNKIAEIARSTEEQSVASNDIAQNIEHISAMAQESDQIVQSAIQTTQTISVLAKELGEQVNRFRT